MCWSRRGEHVPCTLYPPRRGERNLNDHARQRHTCMQACPFYICLQAYALDACLACLPACIGERPREDRARQRPLADGRSADHQAHCLTQGHRQPVTLLLAHPNRQRVLAVDPAFACLWEVDADPADAVRPLASVELPPEASIPCCCGFSATGNRWAGNPAQRPTSSYAYAYAYTYTYTWQAIPHSDRPHR